MSAETMPTYVEDGRDCQIVRVSELLPGDEILGWQGEPWTFGTVARVERRARQSYGPDVLHEWVIHHEDGTAVRIMGGGDEWRRIARCSA